MIDLSQYPTSFLTKMLPLIRDEIKKRKAAEGIQKRISFIERLGVDNPVLCEINQKITDNNSNSLLALPIIENIPSDRRKYLKCILAQDWSHLFPKCGGNPDFYVYVHVDPSEKIFITDRNSGGNYKGNPFYVGKGTGNRAWDLKRNQGHGKKIQEVLGKGYGKENIVYIPFSNLTESKAYEIESKLIYFFGTIYEGRKNATLYNLDIPKRPEFIATMTKFKTKQWIQENITGVTE